MNYATCKQGTYRSFGLGWIAWPIRVDEEIKIIVVATCGAVDDWAAYIGPAEKGAEWTASYGNKLPPEDAARLFPVFNAKRYRL